MTSGNLAIALVSWALLLVTLRATLSNRRRDPRVRVMPFVFFAMALAATLELRPVYLALDASLPINNLAWLGTLLVRIIGMVPVIFCGLYTAKLAEPRWLRPATSATVGALFLLYIAGPMGAPEAVDHIRARSGVELLFISLPELHTLVGAAVVARSLQIVVRREHHFSVLLRLQMVLLAVLFAELHFGFRLAAAISAIAAPHLTDLIFEFGSALLLVTALAFLLAFLPRRLHERVVAAARHLGDTVALVEISYLTGRLAEDYPRFYRTEPSWFDRMRLPSYYLRSEVVYVLDCQSLLAKEAGGPSGSRFDDLLRETRIAGDAPFEEHLEECRRLSRALVRDTFRLPFRVGSSPTVS